MALSRSCRSIPPTPPFRGIVSGDYDGYLRSYADSVRDFGHAVVIGFGHEMNAPWYSWGYGHVPASTFVAAWRHIVTLFRRQGADNVTWLWTIHAEPGHRAGASWWPGAKYVTWVGIDGYYYRPSDTFASVFGQTIDQVREFTRKPVLLSETAVGPRRPGCKIQNLFAGMNRYKTLGLVWFDMIQDQGIYHQDWRIEDSPEAKAAFRQSIRDKLAPAGLIARTIRAPAPACSRIPVLCASRRPVHPAESHRRSPRQQGLRLAGLGSWAHGSWVARQDGSGSDSCQWGIWANALLGMG